MFYRNGRLSFILWLAVFGTCTPWHIAVAESTEPFGPRPAAQSQAAPRVTDVMLGTGGRLTGQVYDVAGVPAAGVEVALLQYTEAPQLTVSDSAGNFAFDHLAGGTYQLIAGGGSQMVRAWALNTAPPSATASVLVVVGDQVVRGDWTDPGRAAIEWCRAHPWLTTTAIVTAVAVPLAIAADDDDNS